MSHYEKYYPEMKTMQSKYTPATKTRTFEKENLP